MVVAIAIVLSIFTFIFNGAFIKNNETNTIMVYMVGSDLESQNGAASGDGSRLLLAHLLYGIQSSPRNPPQSGILPLPYRLVICEGLHSGRRSFCDNSCLYRNGATKGYKKSPKTSHLASGLMRVHRKQSWVSCRVLILQNICGLPCFLLRVFFRDLGKIILRDIFADLVSCLKCSLFVRIKRLKKSLFGRHVKIIRGGDSFRSFDGSFDNLSIRCCDTGDELKFNLIIIHMIFPELLRCCGICFLTYAIPLRISRPDRRH